MSRLQLCAGCSSRGHQLRACPDNNAAKREYFVHYNLTPSEVEIRERGGKYRDTLLDPDGFLISWGRWDVVDATRFVAVELEAERSGEVAVDIYVKTNE